MPMIGPKSAYLVTLVRVPSLAELDVEGLGPVFQWEIVVAACFGVGHRYVGSAVDDAWRW